MTYELTFHTPLEDTASIRAIIAKHGRVVSERAPVKVKLGYPIKRQSFAFLGVTAFEAEPEAIAALSEELNLADSVLRFQISRVAAKAAAPQERPAVADGNQPSAPRPPARIKPFDSTLSNEALEKKIEEILK